ncbi:MAG: rhodanese-like domain-containing protein [Phycisphaerales bacterium]|nr:rhodanese-like domain-containing protein [Phycisphaerales bacterium]
MPKLARIAVLLLALASLLLAAACDAKTSDRDLQTVNSHEAIELAARKGAGPFSSAATVVWVDPRSSGEFEKAHIPEAINIPFGGPFEQDANAKLRGADVIVVYATSVQDVLGIAASKRLIELGYRNVYTLKGGLRQWVRDGNAAEGSDPESVN